MPTCELLTDADRSAWQEFALTHPQCGLYHHLGWKDVVESAYGHLAPYLVTKSEGRITGVLPLVLIKSRIFGSSLTSLPFLDFGGIAAADGDSRRLLLDEARSLGERFGVDYVELRQVEPNAGDIQTSTHKVLMTMDLGANEDELWKKLSSERRNRVRRAQKSDLAVDVADRSKLALFYDIWTKNMRDLGSPPHSLEFFDRILTSFGDRCAILLVRYGETYIGAALALYWKDTLSVPWVSSLREHFRLYPNNILYWEAMRFAIAKGITRFDFGRSTEGSGTYQFKQRWGAVATPLYWQFLPISGRQMKPGTDDGKFGLAVQVWKRMPVAATRWVGPALRKNITA